jgi:hypothetical protein
MDRFWSTPTLSFQAAGYVLAESDSWPRQLDVSSGGNIAVDIHLTAR